MNNKIKIREASIEEIENWDQLVGRYKNHRISHTLGWLRSLENSVKGTLLFLVYERGGEIVGCLPGMLVRVGPFKLFGSSLPGWQTISMGPVFDENEVSTNEMIEPLIPFLEKNYGVHHVEIMCNSLNRESMEKTGFRGKPEYTFQAPLYPDDIKKVFRKMKPSARRNITRAEELGLIAKFMENESFVDEVYEQITEVFLHGGNVVPFSKNRVLEFFRKMSEAEKMLAIGIYLPDGKTCIATGLFTIENKELLLWMWTHRRKYGWYRPTEFMTWTAMQKAMEQGCDSFDLMGRGQFKAKLGAVMTDDKYRWTRSRYRWLTAARNIAEKCYRWQQSLRGKFAQGGISGLLPKPKKEAGISHETVSA